MNKQRRLKPQSVDSNNLMTPEEQEEFNLMGYVNNAPALPIHPGHALLRKLLPAERVRRDVVNSLIYDLTEFANIPDRYKVIEFRVRSEWKNWAKDVCEKDWKLILSFIDSI